MKEVVSTIESEFVLESLKENLRIDERKLSESRKLELICYEQLGRVEAVLGLTRVIAIVSAEIVRPYPDRPTEGIFNINTEFSQMANLLYDSSKMLEKVFKIGRVLDTESLCIVAGEQAWSIKLDIRILNDEGNIVECASIAAISALLHFKRPEVAVIGESVTVFSTEEKNPVPLGILHIPICISFAFFILQNGDEKCLIDPTLLEQKVAQGELILCINSHKEICAISKIGLGVNADLILQCSKMAAIKASEIIELIQSKSEMLVNK